MSKLQVTTIDLESTGNNRIEYVGSNTVNFVAGNNIFATSNGSVLSIGSDSVTPILAGPSLSYRNKLINGNFDIWQRATSNNSVANAQFIADRWMTLRANTTANVARQTFTLGQTDVPNEPTYFYRTTTTSNAHASSFCLVTQRIEYVKTLSGKNATVSFYAKADAAKPIAVELVQNFGSGGSPSSEIQVTPQKITLSTSWTKYSLTFAVPSISGKTIGSNSNDYLALNFWLDAGSTYNNRTDTLGQQSGVFDFSQIQVEEGTAASSFEERPVGLELSLCQRYYEFQTYDIFSSGYGQDGAAGYKWTPFAVVKRATPTMTNSAIGYNSMAYLTTNTVKIEGVAWHAWYGSTGAGSYYMVNSWTATAEL